MQKYGVSVLVGLAALAAGPSPAATPITNRFGMEAQPKAAQELTQPPINTPTVKEPPVPELVPPVKTVTPLSSQEIEMLGVATSGKAPADKVEPVLLSGPKKPGATPKTPAETPMPQADAALKNVLAYVYEHHPQLAAEREKVKAMDENVAIAVSDFRPSAVADYGKGRERQNNTATGRWEYGDTETKGLTVVQPVFSGLSGVAGFKAAKERLKAARADLTALEQQVLFNAVVAYTDLVEKQSVLNLAQNNVDVLIKQRDAAQIRFDVGELTKTDVAQAESRLATAKADEQRAVGDLATARARYVRLIGIEPEEGVAMPGVPTNLPQTLEEANALAREANPILQAAKQREKAFASDIRVRSGAILPSVDIEGTMRRSEGGNVFINRYENDAIMLNVTVPLYQTGAEWARVRQARNLAQQAKFDTIDTGLAVSQDVTSAWQNYVTAESVIVSTEKAAKASELALEGVRQENEYGVRTVLDVLDAEQEYMDTKVNLVRAIRNHKIEAYRLLASVGKLTVDQLGLGIKAYDPKENYDNVKYQLLGW